MASGANRRPRGAGRSRGRPGRVTERRPSGRYTPPIPRTQKVSPRWVPVLMFALLGLGMLTIVANYLNLVPGGTSNGWLIGGLVMITGGFLVATQYH
ncbi:MAG: hypothetical protein C4344_06390 [Acidimicrobiia bacterium]